MEQQLESMKWYWVRRDDGSLAPYLFHKKKRDPHGNLVGEFFMGSKLTTWSLGRVVGVAEMPGREAPAG
ncbi:MAG: hypothetical protein CMJ79_11115 [Planctomycetaceae bacterium]|nr:hypothetical protein [Planctomycetaceae bacterium]|tara:strand:+ start:1792 stop:1998 length:207 start_codon:yes stop_codon:yes gene_type:complete